MGGGSVASRGARARPVEGPNVVDMDVRPFGASSPGQFLEGRVCARVCMDLGIAVSCAWVIGCDTGSTERGRPSIRRGEEVKGDVSVGDA